MGSAPSKIEEDKALSLCQERKRFVREALDGRCSLAATHFSYVESLRNTGVALRKFADSDSPTDPSLWTNSTSESRDPLPQIQKPVSQFSNVSPVLSKQDSYSPSSASPRQFHVNHMKAARITSKTVEEKPPVSMKVTLESPVESINFEEPPLPPPGTWDYFGLFHPTEEQYTLEESHTMDHTEDIRRVREEEGIPELEEEIDEDELKELDELEDEEGKEKINGGFSGDEFGDTDEDEFSESSKEPLVRIFKNRNLVVNNNVEDLGSDTEGQNGHKENYGSDESVNMSRSPNSKQNIEDFGSDTDKKNKERNGPYEKDEIEVKAPVQMHRNPNLMINREISNIEDLGSAVNGKHREYERPNARNKTRDLGSCMKEIEELFIRAAESGKEVPRMLEADKVNFRPLLPDETGQGSSFLLSLFGCCGPEPPQPQPSAPVEMKYLTWNRSASSLSSSSRNPIGESNKDNIDFHMAGGVYMNSGSHASTLDRLYAWERKLYDEVKASGAIRRDYDFKCKLLRNQESRGESPFRVDKTRSSVKDLHSRIRVAIHRIDKISKTIEDIRDKELQPQLEELIEGLTRMWGVMQECHRQQLDVILLTSPNGSVKFSIRPDSQSHATLTLVNELNLLCSNFTRWISSHKSYLISIDKWVRKCVSPRQQNPKRNKRNKKPEPEPSLSTYGAPPIFATCEDWLKLLEELPTIEVVGAIKELASVAHSFLPRQEKSKGFKSSMSLATNGPSSDEINGGVNSSLVDLRSNCESLQSRLAVFLEKLVNFAYVSCNKYEVLQQSIKNAKEDYLRERYRQ